MKTIKYLSFVLPALVTASAQARWLSVDPVGFKEGNPASFNRYAYANNNPYKFIDPDGRESVIAINGPVLGNPFGHTAQGFTGKGVFSYGTTDKDGGSFSNFVLTQAAQRDSVYYIIHTSPEQDQAMLSTYLQAKKGSYDKVEHNCAKVTAETLSASGLEWTGSLSGKSEFVPGNINRLLMEETLQKHNTQIEEISVPKGTTTVPTQLQQFDPK